MIKGLNKGKPVLIIACQTCGSEYESPYKRGQLKKYLKEFGHYENHHSDPCPNCGTAVVINLNLHPGELTEVFFAINGVPGEEIQERRSIKAFMEDLTFEGK